LFFLNNENFYEDVDDDYDKGNVGTWQCTFTSDISAIKIIINFSSN